MCTLFQSIQHPRFRFVFCVPACSHCDISFFFRLFLFLFFFFFFSSRRRHTRLVSDWSSDVCSSDLSIDFHAARIPMNKAFRTILPKVSLSFEFIARDPGAYLVHCGTPPVLLHRSEERRVGKECRSRWSQYD